MGCNAGSGHEPALSGGRGERQGQGDDVPLVGSRRVGQGPPPTLPERKERHWEHRGKVPSVCLGKQGECDKGGEGLGREPRGGPAGVGGLLGPVLSWARPTAPFVPNTITRPLAICPPGSASPRLPPGQSMWHHLSCKEPGTTHGPNCRLHKGDPGVTVTGHDNLVMRQWLGPECRPQTQARALPPPQPLPAWGRAPSRLVGSGQPCLSSRALGLPSFLPLSPGLTTMTVVQSFPGQTDRVPPWTAQHSVLEPPGSSMEQMAQMGPGRWHLTAK